MSILLSIIILLADRSLIIESAPKLGHILYDPLSNEAKLSGTSIKNIIFNLMNNSFHDDSTEEHKSKVLRSKLDIFRRNSENTESNQTLYFGYDFNDSICKTLEDRVICGYDKNIGEVDNKIVDLGNGCRIRGDRLECGYLVGPFNNSRRSPGNEADNELNVENRKKRDNISKNNNLTSNYQKISTPASIIMLVSTTRKKNTITSTIDTKTSKGIVKNVTMTSLLTKTGFISSSSRLPASHTNVTSETKEAVTKKHKKHCVENKDHIFCYNIKV